MVRKGGVNGAERWCEWCGLLTARQPQASSLYTTTRRSEAATFLLYLSGHTFGQSTAGPDQPELEAEVTPRSGHKFGVPSVACVSW